MAFNWVSASLVGAALLAIVHVVDSHLIAKRMPSLQSYLIVTGFMLLLASIVVIILFPLPKYLDGTSLMMSIISGILRATSAYLIFHVLKKEEVSMVIPVVNSYPILVAIFAMPILGEFLDTSQWIAITIVVLGVILASLRRDSSSKLSWSGSVLSLLGASSVLFALSEVTAKYALALLSPWQMYSISHFAAAFVFLIISIRPRILRELAHHENRNSSIIIIFFNEIIAITSTVLFYWAMERGLVSLVSAISSTRPVFVFIYALIISRFSELLLERRTNKGVLLLRFIAISMIVGGVAIIYLT